VVASVIGGLALATSVAFAGSAAGDSPGVPTSSVTTISDKTAQYCVTNYAPNATVSVHNEKTGDSASIHTNHRGAGCTQVPVSVDCGHLVVQSIVAAGIAADGNPGTSSAPARVPGNVAPCDPTDGSSAPADDTSSLSGTAKGIIAAASGAAVVLGTIGVILVRRRRAATEG